MNILLCSVPFAPSVGGIETVSALLAVRFERLGNRVVVVTRSESMQPDAANYRIVRRPSTKALFDLVRWADAVFHNNIGLRFAWPLLLLRRPWIVAHHTWIPHRGAAGRLKRWAAGAATNIAVSQAIADDLPVSCRVVPNPYADDVFVPMADVVRRSELIFLGRLVSDKGVSVLLDALALLARRGRIARLTVIGDGPEASRLQAQSATLGLAEQISFVGHRSGRRLAATLNGHEILVVPSVWEEPFGVVALEAMACGAVPLVTRSGGLPEAVGAHGLVVAKADPGALADGIEALLSDPALCRALSDGAAAHLARHSRERVARDYLRIIDDACRAHAAPRATRAV